jgi:hypothetical protein
MKNGYLMIGARAFVAALLSWALVQWVLVIGVESVSSVISQNIEVLVVLGVPILVAVGVSAWICARTNRLLGRKKAVASAAASSVGIAVVLLVLALFGSIVKKTFQNATDALDGSPIRSKQQ